MMLVALAALASLGPVVLADSPCADDGSFDVYPKYGPGSAPTLYDQPYFDGGQAVPTNPQALNLYPTSASDVQSKVPLAIFVHGGGWKSKDRSVVEDRWNELDLRYYGFAVASLGYRLSQQATWPAQDDDLKAGVKWLYDHADEHGLDRDRFILYGQSAGGHLVSAYGMNHNEGGRVKAIVDFYGPVGISFSNDTDNVGINNPESSVYQLLGCAPINCPEKAQDADPVRHVSSDDPPLLIIHGTADDTVNITSSEYFYQFAKNAFIDSAMISTDGAGHSMGTTLKLPSWGFEPANSVAASASNQTKALLRWLNERNLVLCDEDGGSPPVATPPVATPPVGNPPVGNPPMNPGRECLQQHCQSELVACVNSPRCNAIIQQGSNITRAMILASELASALVQCGCEDDACPQVFGGLCGAFDSTTAAPTTTPAPTTTTKTDPTTTKTDPTTTAAAPTTTAAAPTTTAAAPTTAAPTTSKPAPTPAPKTTSAPSKTTLAPTKASGAFAPSLSLWCTVTTSLAGLFLHLGF